MRAGVVKLRRWRRGFGCGVLATKSILDTTKPAWAIPATLIALLLN